MTTPLYLFVTSDRPDQYLNSILHCLRDKNIVIVIFLYVENAPWGSNSSSSTMSVRGRVETLLSKLASEGKYRYFSGPKKDTDEDLQAHYTPEEVAHIRGKYTSFKDRRTFWRDEVIDYYQLREKLARIRKRDPSSIFDVTSLGKEYLGDIIALGLFEGIEEIYSFKFLSSPSSKFDTPWKLLFHDLEYRGNPESGYDYINLTKTPICDNYSKKVVTRKIPLSFSLGAAIILLLTLIITSFIFGTTNWFALSVTSLATIASIFSLIFTILPLRK